MTMLLFMLLVVSFYAGVIAQRVLGRSELARERLRMLEEVNLRKQQLAAEVQTVSSIYSARNDPEMARRIVECWEKAS